MMTIDVGKVFVDKVGAGRIYIPKRILDISTLEHKDRVKLEVVDNSIVVTPLKNLKWKE